MLGLEQKEKRRPEPKNVKSVEMSGRRARPRERLESNGYSASTRKIIAQVSHEKAMSTTFLLNLDILYTHSRYSIYSRHSRHSRYSRYSRQQS